MIWATRDVFFLTHELGHPKHFTLDRKSRDQSLVQLRWEGGWGSREFLPALRSLPHTLFFLTHAKLGQMPDLGSGRKLLQVQLQWPLCKWLLSFYFPLPCSLGLDRSSLSSSHSALANTLPTALESLCWHFALHAFTHLWSCDTERCSATCYISKGQGGPAGLNISYAVN